MSEPVDKFRFWLVWLSGMLIGSIAFGNSGPVELAAMFGGVLLTGAVYTILKQWRENRGVA